MPKSYSLNNPLACAEDYLPHTLLYAISRPRF
jgi:hypothetical protein